MGIEMVGGEVRSSVDRLRPHVSAVKPCHV